MMRRDKETVSRHSALERDSASAASHSPLRNQPANRGLQRLIPLLIVAFIIVLVARDKVPAVATWWEKSFSPQTWEVKQVCHQAAAELADNRQFARLIAGGVVHDTEDGYYLDGLVLGEMAPDGSEQRVAYSCYLDRGYRLVKINRLE